MSKTLRTLILAAAAAAVGLTGCRRTSRQAEETATPADTLRPASRPDSTLWGHLGDGTAMSVLEFVTDEGDTLDIYRTNQLTGQDGALLGEIGHPGDRFAITLQPDGESLLTGVNVSQLARQWHGEDGTLHIKPDGTAVGTQTPYNGWKLWNGHILLSSDQQNEYARIIRVDTMDIIALEADSLIIRDHLGQFMHFGQNSPH